jgi:hypothetical protein
MSFDTESSPSASILVRDDDEAFAVARFAFFVRAVLVFVRGMRAL